MSLALVLVGACGGVDPVVGDGGADAAGGPAIDAAAGEDAATDAGGGGSCGGLGGVICAADEYCDYPADDCGADDGQGTCRPRPQGCPDLYLPTCGCDGVVHGNACDGYAVGVDVSNNGGCPAPEGQFACGAHFCTHGIDYCQRAVSDVGGEPDMYQCNSLPAGCGATPTCACLASEPCGAFMCSEPTPGDLTLICPGG